MTEKLRDQPAVQIGVDKTGKPIYRSFPTGKSDVRRSWLQCPPHTVIPIVFVPGIMGSNLKAKVDIKDRKGNIQRKNGTPVWRVDGQNSMAGWLLDGPVSRQLLLNKDVLEVDPRGDIEGNPSGSRQPDCSMCHESKEGSLATPRSQLSVATARSRGWGEVSAMFYGEFLDWLEQQLNHASISPHGLACETLQNHFENLVGQRPPGAQGNPPALTEEQVRHVTNFDFPVHAFGYNWLESNLDSGKHLVERINKIRDYYRAQGRKCDKVILATHSMGGLVARAACKVHGGEELVWGVVHGVMPTDGAAATYKRFVAGFGGEGGGIKGSAVSMILGATGPQATPVLAFAPGPMELLPNKQYNQGQPWFWIKDASGHVTLSLPETGDPYKEIYERQDVWWRMVNPEWLNPAGMDIDNPLEEHFFALGTAQAFHEVVHKAGNLHKTTFAHYGMDESRKAWSGVGWDAKRSGLTLANMRNVGNGRLEDALYKGHAIATVATVSHPDAAGDGTVPGLASGAGVDSGAQLVCRQTGYAHDGSYNDAGARQSVLDAILRIIAPIPEPT